jgi:hypothetical protein
MCSFWDSIHFDSWMRTWVCFYIKSCRCYKTRLNSSEIVNVWNYFNWCLLIKSQTVLATSQNYDVRWCVYQTPEKKINQIQCVLFEVLLISIHERELWQLNKSNIFRLVPFSNETGITIGRQVMRIAHMTLWVRWAKNVNVFLYCHFNFFSKFVSSN